MKFIISVLLLFLTITLRAQIPQPFAIDTVSSSITSALPFDKTFVLQVRGQYASSVYTWMVVMPKKSDVFEDNRFKFSDEDPKIIKGESNSILKQKNGVDIYIDPLPPNKEFAIALGHHFDGDLLVELFQINELIRNNKTIEADKRLINLPSLANARLSSNYRFSKDQLKKISFNFFNWYDEKIKIYYHSFYSSYLKDAYDHINDSHNFIALNNLLLADIKAVLVIADGAKMISPELIALGGIKMNNKMDELQQGLIALTPDYSKQTDPARIDTRANNIQTSLTSLDNLKRFLEALSLRSNDPVIGNVITHVNNLLTSTKAYSSVINSNYEIILQAISEEPNLTYTTWLFGNNNVLDLKTRGSYQIIPVVGVATFVAIGNEQNQTLARPYLGASIYLRPVDKDIPFQNLNNKFLHRFSINIGMTTGSINKGEFTDYYNSLSLLVGGNYKITRAMSISAGTILLQRKNVNPAINDSKATFNPYVGLSFDLDFMYSIQKLIDKL